MATVTLSFQQEKKKPTLNHMQEDSFFMEAVNWGHLWQPFCTEKGWAITIWGNYSTLGEKREKMRKSLISIISWISLWVTQHHREKKMASFHGGWGEREWEAFIAVNHSESTRGKAALAAFVVNALPRFICLSQILHLQLEPTWRCGKTLTFLD